jgi:hypothetical protein
MRAKTTGSRLALWMLVMSGIVTLWALTGTALAQDASPQQQAAPSGPGSAPVSSTSTSEVDVLRKRAATFWAARVAGDYTKQWELLEPRGRGRMTAAEYAAPRNVVRYLAYQVEDANVGGAYAKVKVRLIIQPTLPFAPQRKIAPSAAVVEDPWVKVQGTWYHSLE